MIVNRDNLLKKLKSVYPFNRADLEQLSILGDKTEVVFFKSGDMIYLEGANAKYFYIIFEGEVEILREENRSLKKKNHLYQGDLLGEDVFLRKHQRQTSARALDDTLLIRISLPVLARFIQGNPELRDDFQFLAEHYQVLVERGSRFDLDTETIYYIGQPHKIYLAVKSLLLLLITLLICGGIFFLVTSGLISAGTSHWLWAAAALIYLLWFTWNFLEWSNDLYIFTDRRVMNQEQGVFLYEGREETPLDMIISLSSQASFLGRQYGFGDLFIKTFTGSFRLKNVPDVDRTRQYLEYVIEKNHLNKHREEKKDFENLLRERMGRRENTDRVDHDDPSGAGVNQIQKTSFLQRLLGLKRNQGDNVIYRTHWIFLVRKTVSPFFILVSLILLLIYLHSASSRVLASQFVLGLFLVLIFSAGVWWLYQYLDWRNDQYIITPQQLIDVYRKPLGLEDRRTAPLENIQSIRYQRIGIPGLLFNYGTVYVKVGNEDFTFDNVYHPLEIQQTLFAYLERADLIEKRANLVEQQHQMADWMDTYQQFSREHSAEDEQSDK